MESRGSTAIPHVYRRPDLPLAGILCCGVYVKTQGQASHADVHQKCAFLLNECKRFHERELEGSRLDWVLFESELPCAASKHDDDPNGFYDECLASIQSKAAEAGCLGPVLVGAYTLARYDHIVFTVFADWGQEDLSVKGRAALEKYYLFDGARALLSKRGPFTVGDDGTTAVAGAAAAAAAGAGRGAPSGSSPPADASPSSAEGSGARPQPTLAPRPASASGSSSGAGGVVDKRRVHEYLASVTRAGGSRSSFLGSKRLSDFAAVLPTSMLAALHSHCDAEPTRPQVSIGPHTVSILPREPRVSWGFGMVTQEAFIHPEIPGSDCVTYHEGLGHSCNMPHPSDDNADGDHCVMGRGQYQRKWLREVFLCDEIKRGMMWTTAGGGGGASMMDERVSVDTSSLGESRQEQLLALCSLAGRTHQEAAEDEPEPIGSSSFAALVESRVAETVIAKGGRCGFLCATSSSGPRGGARQITIVGPTCPAGTADSSGADTSSSALLASLQLASEVLFSEGKTSEGKAITFEDLFALVMSGLDASSSAADLLPLLHCSAGEPWPERQFVPLLSEDAVEAAAKELSTATAGGATIGDIDVPATVAFAEVASYSWQSVDLLIRAPDTTDDDEGDEGAPLGTASTWTRDLHCALLYDAGRDFKAVIIGGQHLFLSCERPNKSSGSHKKNKKEEEGLSPRSALEAGKSQSLQELFGGPYFPLYRGSWVSTAASHSGGAVTVTASV